MKADWQYEVPTTGTITLPPDSRYMEALTSQGYGFESAIADLIDNSIDAGAKDVVVHFLRDADRLVSLLIIDDGCGMNSAELDVAMTVGGRRDYKPGSLGMFGTGLKSASLSHAGAVTVATRTKSSRPVGRRWVMDNAKAGFQCDIVDPAYAQSLIDRYAGCPIKWQGTVVRWDNVKEFPQHGGSGQTDRYLTKTIARLARHLGLQLHRFLESPDFNITIAVEDVATGTEYSNYGVEALDPFGYPTPGRADYPKKFTTDVPGVGRVKMRAHIWPPKSNLESYKAVGSVMDRQGLYFYRNNRLVQAGGWNNFRQPEQHLSLARVEVELPDIENDVFRLTVKKDGVEAAPAFAGSLEQAVDDDGALFGSYILAAQEVYRTAQKRSVATRKAVIKPGSGIERVVRDTFANELEFIVGEDPIEIRWTKLNSGEFFEIDRDNRAVQLNKKYRSAILGGRSSGLSDAPVVKTLMYLLLHDVFQHEYSGPREKDNILLWQSVLSSAAEAELNR